MTENVILFARNLPCRLSPCYNLVSRWLTANGVDNVPSDTVIRRWWRLYGVEQAMINTAALMRLTARHPRYGDVAVISQGDENEPILGLIAGDGLVVVRSFGVMQVRNAFILRSWGFPWEK